MGGEEVKCNLYQFNQSDPFHIGNPYGGLPTNLVINGIGWLVLILLFLLVRKSAFKYIKLMRIRRASILTTTSGEADTSAAEPPPCSFVFFGGGARSTTYPTAEELEAREEGAENGRADLRDYTCPPPYRDRGTKSQQTDEGEKFWSWFIKVFKLSDSQLKAVAGTDAMQYLRFQRFILGYVIATTVLSIGIILPINFQGTQYQNATDFGHTTLGNLEPGSSFLWAHIFISFLLFPTAIFIMRRFSAKLKFRDPGLEITRTLNIFNIPEPGCQRDLLLRHFKEAYPRLEVADLKIVYDVAKLTALDLELRDAVDSLRYGKQYRELHDQELMMRPRVAARYCSCCCAGCIEAVSVVDYYTKRVNALTQEVEKQKDLAVRTPIGMAFVTFKSVNDAKQVYCDHSGSRFLHSRGPPLSSLSTVLKNEEWKMRFAPPPRDIYWQNLSVKREWYLFKWIASNITLFIVAFFLTTPAEVVSQLDKVLITIFGPTFTTQSFTGSSVLKDFLPTIMIWTFTALLPALVAFSDRWLGRWTRSEENHNVMRKTFWYLLFMVVILPTFGFTTGQAYFNFLFLPHNDTQDDVKWECVMMADSGAFFVNYVITAALLGSSLELIRFPELFWYAVQICLSKSEADTPAIQRSVVGEFRFGEEYARMLLIFSMVMMYSISCPLITPFGCLYFLLKHFADRHNLIFVYKPSKINKKVHASAINFVIMSVGLLQFFTVVFLIIRSGDISVKSPMIKCAIVLLFITINIFTAQIWSNICRRLSPIKYEDVLYIDDGEDDEGEEYLPEVLKDCFPRDGAAPAPASPGYGTF